MAGILAEIRSAIRRHLQQPGVTATVVLSLALGIGAVTAVFQLAYDALLRPLPFPRSDRVFEIVTTRPAEGLEDGRVSYADFRDWAGASRSFSHLAAVSDESLVLTGDGGAQRIAGARVTPELFQVFALPPILGTVSATEWREPGARVAVLSEGFWRRRFGSDPAILGRTLRLDDQVVTVSAVMPAGLDYPRDAALWLPLDAADPATGVDERGARYLRAVGRLADGATPASAGRELRALSQRLAAEYPETNAGRVAALLPLRERFFGDVRPGMILLSVAVACVLLIVCSNVAGVLLARSAARGGDLWIRLALGSTRGRLGRLILVENLLLTLAGATLGLLLGSGLSRLMTALSPRELVVDGGWELTAVLAAFTLGLALVVGLFVTLPCALQAARQGRSSAAGRGAVGSDRLTARLQAALLTVQLAVTVALLVGSGLMLRSTLRLMTVDAGFRTENVFTARISLPASRYREAPRKIAFFDELLERLRARPEILSAAAVTNLPLSGSNMTFGVSPAGTADKAEQETRAHYRAVTPGYFRALGVPLVEGRDLEPGDDADAPPVVVVNQTFARRLFPAGDALGREVRITFGAKDPRRIVGVVGDLRHAGLDQEPQPEMYVPFAQQPWSFMTVVVHTRDEPRRVREKIRAAVAAIDPDQPVDRMTGMAELVDDSIARTRFYGALLGAFAALALVTAAVGIYGLTSYGVSLRRDEIGVRMALGSTPRAIRRHVLRPPFVLGLAGVVLGSALALALGRVFESLLYGVSPDDPYVLGSTALGLLLAVLLAAWLPARQATRVDPALILRRE